MKRLLGKNNHGIFKQFLIIGRKVLVLDWCSIVTWFSFIWHQVWKNYRGNNIVESVDANLKGTFPIKEASNVLQIGLLCTQASLTFRPSMFEVVQMLTNIEYAIPLPKQPPFLNASVLTSENSRTSDIKSFVSLKHEQSTS